jgi:hypothetical protein
VGLVKESDAVIGVLTHVETLIAFVVFLVPGFLSVRAYEARRGGDGRKINEALVDVVIYSFATDIIWVPLIYLALQIEPLVPRVIVTVVALALGFVVTPLALGVGWYR